MSSLENIDLARKVGDLADAVLANCAVNALQWQQVGEVTPERVAEFVLDTKDRLREGPRERRRRRS